MKVSTEMKPRERIGLSLLLALTTFMIFGAFVLAVYAIVQAVKCGLGG
jgi:hypothetical protein